jgi:prolyl-tRNA editing enzyme YbaK/EbsC (Cys-tRNA(Pro) deacylase)
VSRLSLPDAEEARDATGYERGAITPFGASNPWPVIADASVKGKGRIALGGGAHGVNIHVDADQMIGVLDATVADVTK